MLTTSIDVTGSYRNIGATCWISELFLLVGDVAFAYLDMQMLVTVSDMAKENKGQGAGKFMVFHSFCRK